MTFLSRIFIILAMLCFLAATISSGDEPIRLCMAGLILVGGWFVFGLFGIDEDSKKEMDRINRHYDELKNRIRR